MKKINLGFVGGGMIAQVAHLPFYSRDENITIKYVAEPRPSLKPYLEENFNILNLCDDHKLILQDEEVDAVVLIAPRQATGPLIEEVLLSGKTLITEKPIAYMAEQVERQLNCLQKPDQFFHVGLMKRYDEGLIRTHALFHEMMRNCELGSLLHVHFFDYAKRYAFPVPCHQRPEESRVSRYPTWPLAPDWIPKIFLNTYEWYVNAGIHGVNLLRYFFGNSLEPIFSNIPNKNAVLTKFEWKNVLVDFSFVGTELGQWIQGGEFIFENGRLKFRIPSPMNKLAVTRFEIQTNLDSLSERIQELSAEIKAPKWCFESQAENFIRCLHNKERSDTSGQESLNDHLLIEKIWEKAVF